MARGLGDYLPPALAKILRTPLKKTIRDVWLTRRAMGGALVGTDSRGNRYFQVPPGQTTFGKWCSFVHRLGRDRYVEYAKGSGDHDPSQVPSEW